MPNALALALLMAVASPSAEEPTAAAPIPLLSAQAAAAGPSDGASPLARLMRDGEAVVSPASTFTVEAGVPLADARLVLYDGQQALVEGEGSSEIGSAQSRFTLKPLRPLRPGSRYVLRLEGAQSRELHDLSGHTFRPLSFSLLASGQPPAEPAPTKAKKKRRR